ncbi:MAG TPA: hypothetical protein IAB83_05155 [Candidatus Faecousia faecavium]|nr:hypothetical protein [Candidatus Faecousia faecavium]
MAKKSVQPVYTIFNPNTADALTEVLLKLLLEKFTEIPEGLESGIAEGSVRP